MKRAFVLRLTQEAQPVGGKFEGRLEEVDSGKSQRFASVEEFLSFLQRCLGDHSTPEDEDPDVSQVRGPHETRRRLER
jgi:hypothetical protein